jgi:hypothetical protein
MPVEEDLVEQIWLDWEVFLLMARHKDIIPRAKAGKKPWVSNWTNHKI